MLLDKELAFHGVKFAESPLIGNWDNPIPNPSPWAAARILLLSSSPVPPAPRSATLPLIVG